MPRLAKSAPPAAELNEQIKTANILDLYLSGMPVGEIAELLDKSPSEINHILEKIHKDTTERVSEMSDTLLMRNLARTERLIQTHYLTAIQTQSSQATKVVMDLIKLENDMLLQTRKLEAASGNTPGALKLDDYEITITLMDDRDDVAKFVQDRNEDLLNSPLLPEVILSSFDDED